MNETARLAKPLNEYLVELAGVEFAQVDPSLLILISHLSNFVQLPEQISHLELGCQARGLGGLRYKSIKNASKIRKLLHDLEHKGDRALLNAINWGEIYYITRRECGVKASNMALEFIDQLPIELVPVDLHMVRLAAEVKAEYAYPTLMLLS